jgi:hypothetical protein
VAWARGILCALLSICFIAATDGAARVLHERLDHAQSHEGAAAPAHCDVDADAHGTPQGESHEEHPSPGGDRGCATCATIAGVTAGFLPWIEAAVLALNADVCPPPPATIAQLSPFAFVSPSAPPRGPPVV